METPSTALKLFVYFAWFMSFISIYLALIASGKNKLSTWISQVPLSTWTFNTITLAIGTYLLVLSQQMSGLVNYGDDIPVVDSLFRTLRLFGAAGGGSVVKDVLPLYFSPTVGWLYALHNSLARLAAPLDAIAGILLVASKLLGTSSMRFLSSKRDTFVFSHLTSYSFSAARSIASHYERTSNAGESDKCLIAFAGTAGMDTSSMYKDAVSRHMICIDQPVGTVIRYVSNIAPRRAFIFSDEDEVTNLHDGIAFVRTLIRHDSSLKRTIHAQTPEVFIASTSPTAESFIDAAAGDAVSIREGRSKPLAIVRRIDIARSTVDSILWDMPLFLVGKPDPERIAEADDPMYQLGHRHVAIVGAGSIGYGFLKEALWCSQMDGLDFTFDVIDMPSSNPVSPGIASIKADFEMDAPEIMRLNGDGPEAEYDVNFLGIDVLSGAYLDYLRKNRDDLTYVLISLGNDVVNAKVARRTREILEQGRFDTDKQPHRVDRPLICAVLRDNQLADAVRNMTTARAVNYEIVPVGTEGALASYNNMFHPELDRMAKNVNRAYWGCYDDNGASSEDVSRQRNDADASFERLEYNRRSSRAAAIHLKYTLFSFVRRTALVDPENFPYAAPATAWTGMLTSGKKSSNEVLLAAVDDYQKYIKLGHDVTRWLSSMEHDRWAAYMRVDGYEVANEDEFLGFFNETRENQNRLSKQHVCLVPFDELGRVSAYVYPKTHKRSDADYERLDDEIVEHLRDILEDCS